MDHHPQNDRLRTLIRDAHMTYADLARAVRRAAAEIGVVRRTNSSAVAHWVAGTMPDEQTVPLLAEVLSRRLGRQVTPLDMGMQPRVDAGQELGLSLETDPVESLAQLARADLGRRAFLANAAYSVAAAALPLSSVTEARARTARARAGGRAGKPEIDAVHEMTQMLIEVDERHGGPHGRKAVVQYLTSDVASLCQARFATTEQHREMLSAAADVAYLAGWKAYDAGEHSLAQRYYLQTYSLATDAGDPVQAAFVLRVMAHNGIDVERPEYTVDLAERAWELVKSRTGPATQALYLVALARAHAYASNPTVARRELDQAWQAVLNGTDAELPRHARLWGTPRSRVASHTAKSLALLSDYGAAEKSHLRAARSYLKQDRPRIGGLSLASAAKMQFRQGHVEKACMSWNRALDVLDGVTSARVSKTFTGVRKQLDAPRIQGVQAVAELRDRLAAAAI